MQPIPPENAQDQTVLSPLSTPSGSQQRLAQGEKQGPLEQKPSLFYTMDQEDDPSLHLPPIEDQDVLAEQSAPFVLPFQISTAMPSITTRNAQNTQGAMEPPPPGATPPGKKRWRGFPLLKLLLIGSVVLITILGASLFVFAQSATSPTITHISSTHIPVTKGTSPFTTAKQTQGSGAKTQPSTKTVSPQAAALPSQQGTETSPSEILPSIPLLNQMGWTQAGLTIGDALEALRTASTFTDREMSYDYRNIGTPTHHSGTLTGATFLLTPGGQIRFTANDVRMINTILYDKIQTGKIIQQVVTTHPSFAHFQIVQVQGRQHLFAWVNVAFTLLQSKRDPATGKRLESLDHDPATGQPLLHQMAVLLVRILPQNQGENAPMGGTGWLVNTYALDATTLPAIATDPSL